MRTESPRADVDQAASSTALILAGAVARGAFEVGALSALAEASLSFRRVVGTSAGALNAAVFAAAVHAHRPGLGAAVLEDLWLDHATWGAISHMSLRTWVKGRGLLDTSHLEHLVQEGLERVLRLPGATTIDPVECILVTTSLLGHTSGDPPQPIHEQTFAFDNDCFAAEADWPRLCRAAAASAAFPGMFAPVDIDGLPHMDGGAVNNAPISTALEGGMIDEVFVVTTHPRTPSLPAHVGGLSLLGHLAEILINERLSRDLLEAQRRNALLDLVQRRMDEASLDVRQRALVRSALPWRRLRVWEIRPETALAGNAFRAFGDRELRRSYIEQGREAALRLLARRAATPGDGSDAGP